MFGFLNHQCKPWDCAPQGRMGSVLSRGHCPQLVTCHMDGRCHHAGDNWMAIRLICFLFGLLHNLRLVHLRHWLRKWMSLAIFHKMFCYPCKEKESMSVRIMQRVGRFRCTCNPNLIPQMTVVAFSDSFGFVHTQTCVCPGCPIQWKKTQDWQLQFSWALKLNRYLLLVFPTDTPIGFSGQSWYYCPLTEQVDLASSYILDTASHGLTSKHSPAIRSESSVVQVKGKDLT